ncbi:GNAT family N-acetyltransferase [Flavobacteriaceae bacterium S356]|uniref:GNAT family N-acetyltransferase n=1 Tax=Asprobacillus argus TaxID=3076534 RepID=A0ABU3LFQ8_9FLAO|nr:GNAT family N-acetyltransferase [Flavobacteriaceae bacterium S356]
MSKEYVFTSDRLGFRTWEASDVIKMFEISSDPKVMQHFPSTQSKEYTANFIKKMQDQFNKNGFCYFAVEILETGHFIGFIGCCEQTYEIDFNPSVDIGWRLHKNFWGKGYATEGAKACLEYMFNVLKLKKIVSVATKENTPSIGVMKKIGMHKIKEFTHPLLRDFPEYQNCVLYELKS